MHARSKQSSRWLWVAVRSLAALFASFVVTGVMADGSFAYRTPCNCTQSDCECCWQRGGACWGICVPWGHCHCTVPADANAVMAAVPAPPGALMDTTFRVLRVGPVNSDFGVTTRLEGGASSCPSPGDSTQFGFILSNPDSGGALGLGARITATAFAAIGGVDSTLFVTTTTSKVGAGRYEVLTQSPPSGASALVVQVYWGGGSSGSTLIANGGLLSCTDWPSVVHTRRGVELEFSSDTTTLRTASGATFVGDRVLISVPDFATARRLVRADLEGRNLDSFLIVDARFDSATAPSTTRASRWALVAGLLAVGVVYTLGRTVRPRTRPSV